jgi:peptidoglycan hydrolase CwlO-like protein
MTEAEAGSTAEPEAQPPTTPTTGDEPATVEEAEARVQEDQERGYRGHTHDYDRDAYTLKTGPESPNALEATLEAKRADAEAQLDELHEHAEQRGAQRQSASSERSAERDKRDDDDKQASETSATPSTPSTPSTQQTPQTAETTETTTTTSETAATSTSKRQPRKGA